MEAVYTQAFASERKGEHAVSVCWDGLVCIRLTDSVSNAVFRLTFSRHVSHGMMVVRHSLLLMNCANDDSMRVLHVQGRRGQVQLC